MYILKLFALTTLLSSGAALAQNAEVEKKMEIKVMITDDEDEDGATEMHWVSNDIDFDIEDLAMGESRTIENESGKTVIITRAEEGFVFDVDGKAVMMPHLGAPGSHMPFAGMPVEPGEPMDIDVRMMAGPHVMRPHHPEGITIVSGKPLDDSVKESIRSVLISAGNDDEVTFIEGSEGDKQVMMRKVEIVH
jgi:hypothetical protein